MHCQLGDLTVPGNEVELAFEVPETWNLHVFNQQGFTPEDLYCGKK
jgi:hypothetical protein